MKYKLLLVSLFIFILNETNAQCTGCTVTISGTETLPQIVGPGSKLCITSSGVLNGDLVINGGEVCNEGTINSNNIVLTSGSLNNIGVISSIKLAGLSGDFDNQGNASIDSLAIGGADINVSNTGILSFDDLAIVKAGIGTNPQLDNTGELSGFNMGISTDALVNNSGDFFIANDFGCGLGATMNNSGNMSVGNDFGNDGIFYTECMIPVANDWANSGTITGPLASSCGGFTVTNASGNVGSFGLDNSNIDMCDQGNPTLGFDANVGSLGSNVTFCSCVNNCSSTTSISELSSGLNLTIFPNPFSIRTTIEFDENSSESYVLMFFDVLGNNILELEGFHSGEIVLGSQLGVGVFFYHLRTIHKEVAIGKILVQ